jgi:hypothetical protein
MLNGLRCGCHPHLADVPLMNASEGLIQCKLHAKQGLRMPGA